MKKLIFFALALIIFITIPTIVKAGPGNSPFALKSSANVNWSVPAIEGWQIYIKEGTIRIFNEEYCKWEGIDISPEARAVFVQGNEPYYAAGDCNRMTFHELPPSIEWPLEIDVVVYWMGNEKTSIITIQEPANKPPECDLGGGGASGLAPLEVTLTAYCDDPNEDPLTYSWDFLGDGVFVDGEESMFYEYTIPGTYEPVVKISDGINPPVTKYFNSIEVF